VPRGTPKPEVENCISTPGVEMGSSPLNLPKAEFHRTAPKAELFNRLKMQNKEKTKI